MTSQNLPPDVALQFGEAEFAQAYATTMHRTMAIKYALANFTNSHG